MNKKLIIMGASGHGKVIADIARRSGYTEIAFLDDDRSKKECLGYKVIGTTEEVRNYKDYDFIIGIGNNRIRRNIQEKLMNDGFNLAKLIHPKSVIGLNVEIGMGTVVMSGAIVNPDTTIGNGCIINTASSIDHDSFIGDYVHISVGSHLAGTVKIGECTSINAGAIVSNNLEVCEDCVIGAGGIVITDIKESGTYVGVPVRKVR